MFYREVVFVYRWVAYRLTSIWVAYRLTYGLSTLSGLYAAQ
jgi:hypothetical protein